VVINKKVVKVKVKKEKVKVNNNQKKLRKRELRKSIGLTLLNNLNSTLPNSSNSNKIILTLKIFLLLLLTC